MDVKTSMEGWESINFDGRTEVNLRPWKLPWKSEETSVEVDRTEVGAPLRKYCGRSWSL